MRLGGAGNKVNRIALDEVDSYINPIRIGFWYLCAPEAILRGMGGLITNFDGKRQDYGVKTYKETKDIEPFVATRTLKLN